MFLSAIQGSVSVTHIYILSLPLALMLQFSIINNNDLD